MSNPSFGQALQAPKLDTLVPDIFRFTVNYGQPLEVMIAAGRYDWVNSDIRAERFPIDEGSGIVEFEGRYFHFTRNIFSEDVVKVIEVVDTNNPWSPAKSEHALSFGATYPGEQRTYPIVGLGLVLWRSEAAAACSASVGATPAGASLSLGGAMVGIRSAASSPLARSLRRSSLGLSLRDIVVSGSMTPFASALGVLLLVARWSGYATV